MLAGSFHFFLQVLIVCYCRSSAQVVFLYERYYAQVTKSTLRTTVKGKDFDPLQIPIKGGQTYNYECSKRVGLLALKQGMLSYFEPNTGLRYPVTVLWVNNCHTLWSHSNGRPDSWTKCMDVGSGERRNDKKVHIIQRNYYKKCGTNVKRYLGGFRVSKDALLPPGRQ